MNRKQQERLTGTAAMPDLWHFAPGGTVGSNNVGPSLLDLIEARPEGCEVCGKPCELRVCDDCLDGGAE